MRRSIVRNAVALFGLASIAMTASRASADPFPTRAERILSPGRSLAGEDSGEALVLNPANLGFLPGRELRWTGVRCPDTQMVACGHAFDLSTPLPFGLGTGLRLDYVQPPGGPEGAGLPYDGTDYVWLTWGVGWKLSEAFAVGATVAWSYSTNPYTDHLVALTAGVSYRPNTRFGFSAVAQDFNRPAPQLLGAAGVPVLDSSYALAGAFRPAGTRAFELGAELRYYEGIDQWRPRATLGVDIPGVGRARGDVELADIGNDQKRGVLATAGLEIAFNGFSAGGGAIFGSALGNSESVAEYATASITSYEVPGVPPRTKAVWIRVESTPGARAHVHMLEHLWKLSEDPSIAAVTMILRSEPAGSYAHAEELADAFRVLKARGKKVLCSFEDAGPKALYACASADKIVVNPAGGVRYAGIATTHIYLKGLLDKLGIKAEFVKIGPHKTAPEQFTNEHASETARADQEDLLAQYEAVFVRNLSLYRHIPEAEIRASTAKGPFVASEARDAHFVDGYAFDDELERATQDLVGRKVRYEKYEDPERAPEKFGERGKIAILYVDGDIIDGRSRTIPLIDTRLVGSYTIAETVKQLKDDADIKGVVLRIESPGGSSMAADVMWRELKLLAEKKPLIVSMGSVAASGGYYIAAPGKMIYALPLTITGSIGVFYGKADVSELLTKIGVTVDVRKTTPRADAESLFRGFTDDERAELDHKVHQFYDTFVDRVAEGRHMSKEDVDAVGRGRVWTGQEALSRKLVDRMGGIREAIAAARAAAHLPDDSPLAEYPVQNTTLLDRALELAGLHVSGFSVIALPAEIKTAARALAPFAAYTDAVPLARMEWIPTDAMPSTEDDDAPSLAAPSSP